MTERGPPGTLRTRNSQRKSFFTTAPKSTVSCGLCKIMSVGGEIKFWEPQTTPVNNSYFLLRAKLARRALCASQRAVNSVLKSWPLFLTSLSHCRWHWPWNFQARIVGWVAISYSRDLPYPGIEPASLLFPALAGRFFAISDKIWRMEKNEWHN